MWSEQLTFVNRRKKDKELYIQRNTYQLKKKHEEDE